MSVTAGSYVKRLRKSYKLILSSALLAVLTGFLFSYAFTPKYTSQSLILVEGQKVPENMVQPVVSEDLAARMAMLQQQVMSQSNLQRVIDRVFPGKNSEKVSEIIDEIRLNMTVEPVVTDLSQASGKKEGGQSTAVPGFYVNFTASRPQEAQQICNELTNLLVNENMKSMQAAANGTSAVLSKGLEDTKQNLDQLDSKLAEFKKQYVGQLPGEEENNLKILMELNSQLEANTQTLNRAQQDKAYTESILAQQLAAWKSSPSATERQTLQQQLIDLQAQLIDLQSRDASEHSDVVKTKADIAQVRKKLTDISKASSDAADPGSENVSAMESPEIRQLRMQVHQYSDLIAGATRNQERYQQAITTYQGRVSLSPAVEEQYKSLTRDYDSAMKSYQDLLAKKSAADLTITMTNMSEGERMFVLNPASLPDSSDSPNRPLFAVVGLGIGLLFGIPFSLLHSRREEKRRSLREGLPVPAAMMKALFDYIGTQLSSSKCDDTLRRASEFIRANSLPEEAVLAWLKEAGADCDCKTLSKAEELLEETVPGYFDLPQPDGVRR